MNLGAAIKSIRKEKGISQKELAKKCDVSVNAMSQIEINATFPQKSTINKICDALEIPVAYLLFFAIDDDDVPAEKRSHFNFLNKPIKELLLEK